MVEKYGEGKYQREGVGQGEGMGRGTETLEKGQCSDSPGSMWRRGRTHRRISLRGETLRPVNRD